MNKYLFDGLKILGFENSFIETITPKIEIYISLLKEYNAKFDLINTDNEDEICVMHILDSLSAFFIIKDKISEKIAAGISENDFICADIGSGSGLPGIPLTICLNEIFPKLNVVLVERMDKRCAFLNTVIENLQLKNIVVSNDQAERISQKSFDLCFFRAFRPLEKKMMKVLLRILKDEGILCAYKAKLSSINEEMSALQSNAPKFEILPLMVPFLTENSISSDGENRERNLVVMHR